MRQRLWLPERRIEAPHLRLRRGVEVEIRGAETAYEGWFTVDLVHARTGMATQQLAFRNLITNAGLDELVTRAPSEMIAHCAVGSGTAAPTVGDAALVTELARTNSNGGFVDASGIAPSGEYHWYRVTRVFTTAQANGNLSEIGMFRTSSGGPMFCRQLLKDANGQATTITKTSEYELRITYEVRRYPVLADEVYQATVSGVAMIVTRRPAFVTQPGYHFAPTVPEGITTGYPGQHFPAYTGSLGLSTGEPAGTAHAATQVTASAYVAGTRYQDVLVQWAASAANAALKSFRFGRTQPTYQHELAAAITKTNTQRLDVAIRQSWRRL